MGAINDLGEEKRTIKDKREKQSWGWEEWDLWEEWELWEIGEGVGEGRVSGVRYERMLRKSLA